MARGVTKLLVKINSESDAKGFTQQEQATTKWARGLSKANTAANAAIVGIVALGKVTSDAASRAQQAGGAIEAAFGRQHAAVERLAAGAADRVGLATSQYNELAAVLGSQLKNLGIEQGKLVGTTDELITLGGDLAATFGGTTADAVAALGSLMRGERDPIERYGVSIKDADIQARLAKQGMDDLTGAARRQAETQATLAILAEQTAGAQGQFARETNSAAGASQIAAANFENAKAALGESLLPVVTQAAQKFAGLAKWVQNNTGTVKVAIGVLGAAAATVKVVNAATIVWTTTTKIIRGATLAWAAAQKVVNVALKSNPIGIVITVVAALTAAVIAAYQRSERFRSIVQSAGRVAKAAFDAVLRAARPLINVVSSIIGFVQRLISAIRNIHWPEPPGWVKSIGSAIGGLFGASDYPGPHEPGGPWPAHTPTGLGLTRRIGFMPHTISGGSDAGTTLAALAAMGAGGGVTIINVNGALDPDAVARQIERLLERRGRRTGRGIITRTALT